MTGNMLYVSIGKKQHSSKKELILDDDTVYVSFDDETIEFKIEKAKDFVERKRKKKMKKSADKKTMKSSVNGVFVMNWKKNMNKLYMMTKNEPIPSNKSSVFVARKRQDKWTIGLLNYIEDITLKMGDIVHRFLIDGDVVLLNRQPTLHKGSMMAKRVRVLPKGKTFRLSLESTKSFNADFDGDEMNIHVPQSYATRIELMETAASKHNIISDQSSSPNIAIVQDSLTSAYLMTTLNERIERHHFFNIMSYISTDNSISRIRNKQIQYESILEEQYSILQKSCIRHIDDKKTGLLHILGKFKQNMKDMVKTKKSQQKITDIKTPIFNGFDNKALFTNPDIYFESVLFNDVEKDINSLLKEHKLNVSNFKLDHNLFDSIETIRQHILSLVPTGRRNTNVKNVIVRDIESKFKMILSLDNKIKDYLNKIIQACIQINDKIFTHENLKQYLCVNINI